MHINDNHDLTISFNRSKPISFQFFILILHDELVHRLLAGYWRFLGQIRGLEREREWRGKAW